MQSLAIKALIVLAAMFVSLLLFHFLFQLFLPLIIGLLLLAALLVVLVLVMTYAWPGFTELPLVVAVSNRVKSGVTRIKTAWETMLSKFK